MNHRWFWLWHRDDDWRGHRLAKVGRRFVFRRQLGYRFRRRQLRRLWDDCKCLDQLEHHSPSCPPSLLRFPGSTLLTRPPRPAPATSAQHSDLLSLSQSHRPLVRQRLSPSTSPTAPTPPATQTASSASSPPMPHRPQTSSLTAPPPSATPHPTHPQTQA